MEEPDDYLGAEFDDAAAAMGEGGEDAEDDVPLPVSKWKPPPIIPKEINEGFISVTMILVHSVLSGTEKV